MTWIFSIDLTHQNKGKNRYLRQQDNSSCVPVSFINTLKWLGYSASKKQISELRELLGTNRYCSGTPIYNIIKYMKRAFPNLSNVKSVERFGPSSFTLKPSWYKENSSISQSTVQEIEKVLENGGIVHVTLHYTQHNTHTFIIIEKTNLGFKCVNFMKNETITDVSRESMKSLLSIIRFENVFKKPILYAIYKNT